MLLKFGSLATLSSSCELLNSINLPIIFFTTFVDVIFWVYWIISKLFVFLGDLILLELSQRRWTEKIDGLCISHIPRGFAV